MNSLKTIEIYNYKSIKHLELNLNRNLNIIVGSNNSGKSNIISAIFESLDVKNLDTAFQSISRLENFERKLPKTILSTSNKQIITLNNKNKHSIEYEDNNTNTIYNENAKEAVNKRIKIAKVDNNTSLDQSIIEIVQFFDDLDNNEVAILLSNINRDLLAISKDYYSLLIFNNELYVADCYGDTAPINEKSNGVKKLIIMSYYINKYNVKNNKMPDIILFDEPEVHLHIEAQRYLYKKIQEVFKNSQIIISTHSTAFINETDINNILLIERDVLQGTYIDYNKKDKVKLLEINQIMGINLLDTLRININSTVVMVEGKTDKIVHQYIYHRLFPKKSLTFIETEGANKISDFITVYKEVFPNPPLGVLDYDKKGLEMAKKIQNNFNSDYNNRIILNNNKSIKESNLDEKIEDEYSIQLEDLFEKEFITKCISELLIEDEISDTLKEDLESYQNFKSFENVIERKNIMKKDSKYHINKYVLNLLIIRKLKELDEPNFQKTTSKFQEIYITLNKRK